MNYMSIGKNVLKSYISKSLDSKIRAVQKSCFLDYKLDIIFFLINKIKGANENIFYS